jgi:hypothetical protein
MSNNHPHFKPTVRMLYALALLGLLLGGSLAARAAPGQPVNQPVASAQHTLYLPLVTVPGTQSSDELIDAALERGEIDAEAALVYRVFATFGDPRLPAKYHGDDSTPSEREIAGELARRFASLSPPAQAILEPFTIPPYHSGSWWDLRYNHAGAAPSSIGPAELRCGGVGSHVPLLLRQWHFVDSSNGMVRVWWQARYPEDEQKARDYAQTVDGIWLKLHALMRRQPPSDEGSTESCGGGGDQLDISLADINSLGETSSGWGNRFSTDATASYILLRRTSKIGTLGTLIHELMHAFQNAYAVLNDAEYTWWEEATAEWAIHYVEQLAADLDTNNEHLSAPALLDAPGLPLETDKGIHPYGAYLFPFSVQLRSGKADFVRQSFERAEKIADSLENLNGLLPGGFNKEWPEFTLRNLNRPPIDDYQKNDSLSTKARMKLEQKVELNGAPSVSYSLDGSVQHLAAHTFHFSFTDDLARSVIFENPFAGGTFPTAHVRVLYQIKGGQWITDDWTNKPYVTFCRDMRADRISELYIVISNSEWSDRSHVLLPASAPRLQATNVGCRGWAVQAEYTSVDKGPTWERTSTIKTTATLERYVSPIGRFYVEFYKIANGTANWTHTGHVGACAGSKSGSYDVRDPLHKDNMTVETYNLPYMPPLVPGSRKYHAMGVRPAGTPPPTVAYVCPNTTIEKGADVEQWLQTALEGPQMQQTIGADGQTLEGNSTQTTHQQVGTITVTSKWTMTALQPE